MAGKPNKPIEYAKEPTGRPSKFTPERRAAIINDIANRVPYEFAAEANGICEETLYDWIRTGKAHRKDGIDSDYSMFSEGIKAAERSRIIQHNNNIADHVDKWQADAWILERRWHKHYGSNAQLNELNRKLDQLMDGEKNEKRSHQESSQENDQEV
jgi:transposase-like protein